MRIIRFIVSLLAAAWVFLTGRAEPAQPLTAVIITGNPEWVEGSTAAERFYNELEDLVRSMGYEVTRHSGAPHTVPEPATVWIGHGRGQDRLRFAPDDVAVIALGAPGDRHGIVHPSDFSVPGQPPSPSHYELTRVMRGELRTRLAVLTLRHAPQPATA